MQSDKGRLRRGERIAGIGGVLLFFLLFFHWYEGTVTATKLGSHDLGGVSAWQAFDYTDIFLLITALAAVGLVIMTVTQRTPALPVTGAVIVTALAAIGTVLVLFRIIDPPGPSGSETILGVTATIDISPTIWAFAGLVAVAATAYGGFLSMRDEGTSRPSASTMSRQSAPPPGTA
jgi:predicted membrane channel-forming protein YqfA (hemolysin III family)